MLPSIKTHLSECSAKHPFFWPRILPKDDFCYPGRKSMITHSEQAQLKRVPRIFQSVKLNSVGSRIYLSAHNMGERMSFGGTEKHKRKRARGAHRTCERACARVSLRKSRNNTHNNNNDTSSSKSKNGNKKATSDAAVTTPAQWRFCDACTCMIRPDFDRQNKPISTNSCPHLRHSFAWHQDDWALLVSHAIFLPSFSQPLTELQGVPGLASFGK